MPPGSWHRSRQPEAVEAARGELAAAFLEDLRSVDARIRETRKKLAAAVQAAGTSLTGLFGVGPVIAAAVIGDVRDVSRFPGRDHFAAYNGTAPIEVSSGPRKIYRLSRRGNRRLNHAIHMAAVTQIGHRHSQGRAYYDKKLAEGKTPKEALRALKRQISNAMFACLQADARRAATSAKSPGGQQGNDSVASAAGSHPRHRLFGQATPGPGHHTTTASGSPAPGPAPQDRSRAQGKAGHSSIAATPPSAQPQVQVERPQRSEDERPGGAARQRPHSAARKARGQGSLGKPTRAAGVPGEPGPQVIGAGQDQGMPWPGSWSGSARRGRCARRPSGPGSPLPRRRGPSARRGPCPTGRPGRR